MVGSKPTDGDDEIERIAKTYDEKGELIEKQKAAKPVKPVAKKKSKMYVYHKC
jgi:hypothetical protein